MTLLAKYLIELGASRIDIVHCFRKNGAEPHILLLLIELLILTKEVIIDKNGRFQLTNKLEDVPKHIKDIAQECMKER